MPYAFDIGLQDFTGTALLTGQSHSEWGQYTAEIGLVPSGSFELAPQEAVEPTFCIALRAMWCRTASPFHTIGGASAVVTPSRFPKDERFPSHADRMLVSR